MNIIIISQKYNPYYTNKIVGGIEMVEKNQITVLAQYGHKIHFITSSDSETFDNALVTTHKLSQKAKFSMQSNETLNNKKRTYEIGVLINNIKPDIIFIHDVPTVQLLNVLNKNIPTCLFIHRTANSGGLVSISDINNFIKASKMGFTLLSVSESDKNSWINFVNNTKLIIDKELIIDDVLYNAIMWKPFIVPKKVNNRVVTIGRLDPIKRFSSMTKMFGKSNTDLTLFYPSIKNEKEQKLFNNFCHKKLKTFKGVAHNDIMKYLSESKLLISFSDESFGFTAFEANSCGVPVLLVHRDNKHPFFEVTSHSIDINGMYYFNSASDDVIHFVDTFKPLSVKERQLIADETYKRYCPEQYYIKLLSIIELSKSKIIKKNTLETFTEI